MRNFVFGDLHGGKDEKMYLNNAYFKEQKELTKKDIVFFLGDFGAFWYYPEYKEGLKMNENILNEIMSKSFTSFVILGNHENYDIIEKLPIVEVFGGKAYEYKNKKNEVLYIAIRGEIYIINDKKIFTFNGAASKDEGRFTLDVHKNGTIVKKGKYRYGELIGYKYEKVKLSQVNHWKQELPTKEEMEYALNNLKKHDNKVDYILTHTVASDIIYELFKENLLKLDPVSEFLNIINKNVEFKEWHFGHFHKNINNGKYFCHYKKKPHELI